MPGELNLAKMEALLNPRFVTGIADIDISEYVYTSYVTLLTITPATGGELIDLQIDLAYNKATTGVSAVATNNDTLDVQVWASADDSTPSCILTSPQVTLTGSTTPLITGNRFDVGDVNGSVIVKVKLSAERADAEIPYKISYKSKSPATITAVEAG